MKIYNARSAKHNNLHHIYNGHSANNSESEPEKGLKRPPNLAFQEASTFSAVQGKAYFSVITVRSDMAHKIICCFCFHASHLRFKVGGVLLN